MGQDNNATSLISHCTSCEALCCHDDMLIASQKERDDIVGAGHPDHFIKWSVRDVDYYILDYKPYVYSKEPMPCPYLGTNKLCSIQENKPLICKAYPLTAEYSVTKKCPAANHLPDDFVDKAIPYIDEIRQYLNNRLFFEIYDAYQVKKKEDFYSLSRGPQT